MGDKLEPIDGEVVGGDLPSNDEMSVAVRQPDSLQAATKESQAMGIAPMAQLIASGSVSIDQIEKMMELQERWEKNEARKAYYDSLSKARGEMPMIAKNRDNSHLNSSYADLDAMIAGAGPVLGRNNLSFNFHYDQSVIDQVTTSCITTHSMGHTESVTVTMPVMKPIQSRSGNSVTNPAQMVGIAMTYGRRYAFAAAFGIATGDDNDGNFPIEQAQAPAPKAPTVPMIDATDMINLKLVIEETGRDEKKTLEYLINDKKYGGTLELINIPKADLSPLYRQLRKSSE